MMLYTLTTRRACTCRPREEWRPPVDHTALTPAVAKDLGKTLRFLRHGRNLTLHDVSKRAHLSPGYIQNLEAGVRTNATEESYFKLAVGYGVPESVLADFILRARVLSALERRGLTVEQQTSVWRGVEALLASNGFELRTDLTKLLADMLAER